MLSYLSQLAVGLAGLRHEYGPDHGRSTAPGAGLGPRHAHLAVGSAHTLCRLLLETLADPKAPWRREAAWSMATGERIRSFVRGAVERLMLALDGQGFAELDRWVEEWRQDAQLERAASSRGSASPQMTT